MASNRKYYEDGIEEGIKKGMAKSEVRIALKLISSLVPLDVISYATGLDMSYISELSNNPDMGLNPALSLYYEMRDK
jgi:hypothetical protein